MLLSGAIQVNERARGGDGGLAGGYPAFCSYHDNYH